MSSMIEVAITSICEIWATCFFPHWLAMGGQEIDLKIGHRCTKSDTFFPSSSRARCRLFSGWFWSLLSLAVGALQAVVDVRRVSLTLSCAARWVRLCTASGWVITWLSSWLARAAWQTRTFLMLLSGRLAAWSRGRVEAFCERSRLEIYGVLQILWYFCQLPPYRPERINIRYLIYIVFIFCPFITIVCFSLTCKSSERINQFCNASDINAEVNHWGIFDRIGSILHLLYFVNTHCAIDRYCQYISFVLMIRCGGR